MLIHYTSCIYIIPQNMFFLIFENTIYIYIFLINTLPYLQEINQKFLKDKL